MKKKKKYNDEYLKDYQSNIIEHKNDLWIPKINARYKTLNINTWFNIEETTNRNKYEKLNINTPKNDEALRYGIKVSLDLTQRQKNILNVWFNAYTEMYNISIKFIKKHLVMKEYLKNEKIIVTKDGIEYNILRYEDLRTHFLKNERNEIIKNFCYEENLETKDAIYKDMINRDKDYVNPYTSNKKTKNRKTFIYTHVIDTAFNRACSNFSSALTNYKEGNIKYFRMRYLRKNRKSRTIDIEPSYFIQNSICPNVLGEIRAFYKIGNEKMEKFDLSKISKIYEYNVTCTLQHLTKTNFYYLCVPTIIEKIKNKNNKSSIFIDPGIRTFGTGISESKCVKIGDNAQNKIKKHLQIINKISKIKLCDINTKTYNKNPLKEIKYNLTKKGTYKNKNKDKYNKNPLKELKRRNNKKNNILAKHRQKIQNLVDEMHHKTIRYLTKNYTTIIIGDMNTEKINRNKTLNKLIKQTASSFRMSEFRKRLKHKCKIYDIKYAKINESYTSAVCSFCGFNKKDLGTNKIFKCDKCSLEIDRDINGSRGIYVKTFMI